MYTDRSFEFIRIIETDYGQRGFSIETLYQISVVLGKDMNSLFKDVNGKIKCRKSVKMNVGFPTFLISVTR